MKKNQFFSRFFLPVLLLTLFVSCKKEVRQETRQESALVSNADNQLAGGVAPVLETDLLKSVRRATAKFHSTTQAIAAGYVPDDHCVSVPGLGGMGYHWANPPLVDPVFDPTKPEVMLYASGPGGNLRLVAVEYIVIDIGQPRPMFENQLFDIRGTPVTAPHWSLHVWLHENNPNGIFRPFNPNITCP